MPLVITTHSNPTSDLDLTFFRGRVALYAILKALGVKEGDEVALPAYTCLAVPEAVLALKAHPIWIDVRPGWVNMDPNSAEERLHSGVKALVVQHTFGLPADLDRLTEIASRKGIPLIEDCCHILRSTCAGRPLGSFGAAAFFSYEWGKPLVAGLGGTAVCNDPELRHRVAALYGDFLEAPRKRDLRISFQYYGFKIGYRPPFYWVARRLNSLAARLGLGESSYTSDRGRVCSSDFRYRMAKTSRDRLLRFGTRDIEVIIAHSDWVCSEYRATIRNPGIQQPPTDPPSAPTVYTRYPLWVSDKPKLMAAAKKAGVEVAGWYETPIHPLVSSEWTRVGYEPGSCPNAERAAREIVTLPTRQLCTPESIRRAVRLLNSLQL